MGTTWYAVDPSSNRGSVRFVDVGLLGTDGETRIGTAGGALPGLLHVELNGRQPGGDGVSVQRGDVALSAEGDITLPPELSMAVGQVFTDDDADGFAAAVGEGAAGMYGLQLRRSGGQSVEIHGRLAVSAGQGGRCHSSSAQLCSAMQSVHALPRFGFRAALARAAAAAADRPVPISSRAPAVALQTFICHAGNGAFQPH